MDTIEIYGVKFLKCDKSDCKWNAGYTPGDLNRHGLEFTAKHDMGIRICNFSCTALALGKDIDGDCPPQAGTLPDAGRGLELVIPHLGKA